MQHRFVLISRWQLDCDITSAWQRICAIRRWPLWWPSVGAVQVPGKGNAGSAEDDTVPRTGDSARVLWKTRLGYPLQLDVTTVRVLPPFELEGTADGDLKGRGLWVLESLDPQGTPGVTVTYRWDVQLTRPWMRLLSPLLRPLFAWNHFDIMRAGARGMAESLNCRLQRYQDYSFAPGHGVEDLRTLHWPGEVSAR